MEPYFDDENEKRIGGGLLEKPHDNRDFSLGGIFGSFDPSKLPKEFHVSEPLIIKNQDVIPNSDLCSAYALTSVLEDHEGVILSPEYTFARIKQISGKPEAWGANLRDAAKSAVEFGALEQKDFPYTLAEKGRDFFAFSEFLIGDNVDAFLKDRSRIHAQLSYFSVDGPHDTFDNIRVALWNDRTKKSSILAGAKWRPEWTHAKGGIIPLEYGDNGFGHAFKIYAWEDEHLFLQLSNGTDIGEKGIFKMPRKVANRELSYGLYTFKDVMREYAEFHARYGLRSDEPILRKLRAVISKTFMI